MQKNTRKRSKYPRERENFFLGPCPEDSGQKSVLSEGNFCQVEYK